MKKYKIEKDTVQETLLIPLYGRKLCSERFPTLFADDSAHLHPAAGIKTNIDPNSRSYGAALHLCAVRRDVHRTAGGPLPTGADRLSS